MSTANNKLYMNCINTALCVTVNDLSYHSGHNVASGLPIFSIMKFHIQYYNNLAFNMLHSHCDLDCLFIVICGQN